MWPSPAELLALTYFLTIAAVALAERWAPLRPPLGSALRRRWFTNIGATALGFGVVLGLLPFTVIQAAIFADESGYGLLADAPVWLAAPVTFLVLDAGKYLQHIALHRLPWLWRLHGAHHSDVDYDFTTALRFHPVEAAFTVTLDLALVIALGGPVEAVLVYEIVRMAVSITAHGNLALPAWLDAKLALALVTPGVHRSHHGARLADQNRNFATVFTLWDRIGGTLAVLPRAELERLDMGLAGHPDEEGLIAFLAFPLQRPAAAEPRPSSLTTP